MWYPNHDNAKIFNDTRINEIMMNIRRLIAIWSGRLIKLPARLPENRVLRSPEKSHSPFIRQS